MGNAIGCEDVLDEEVVGMAIGELADYLRFAPPLPGRRHYCRPDPATI
jgi:hypothetical protein